MPQQLALIKYMGGKQRLVKRLLQLIPPHQVYCEVFGGGASLLLNKPLSPREVYNDIDGNLVNLFIVVRDRRWEFVERCLSLPYSRELYESWRTPFVKGQEDEPEDEVERAVRFFYVIRSAFYGHPAKGWAFIRKSGGAGAALLSALDDVRAVSSRLRQVYIDHLDFRRCIRNWDTPDTFFFLDPPYYDSSPPIHIFTDQDHQDLAQQLGTLQGKWLLTYNDHPAIRHLYAKYPHQRVTMPLATHKVDAGKQRRTWSQLIIRNYLR